MRIITCFVCLLVLANIYTGISSTTTFQDDNIFPSQIITAQTTTRREAIIEYIEALYSPNEGAFYGYLNDWPTDPRIHSYHTIIDLYEPLSTLIYLNAESSFDLTNSTVFATSLLNDESRVDYLGPVNFSRDTPCSTISSRIAVDLFTMLNIFNQLDQDDISNFIKYCQTPSGGFRENIWDTSEEENLIVTQCALYTMKFLNLVDQVDEETALSYVLSCYSAGGFSHGPNEDIDHSYIPLRLLCLEYLNALSSINKEEVVSYILSNWDNNTGSVPDGTIVDTERAIWSLSLIDALDRIDTEAVVNWVLSRQSNAYGEFLPFYGAELVDERFEWTRAAVHILSLLGRLDTLDQEFTVFMTPEHTIPQGYYDFIEQHFGTTTNDTTSTDIVALPIELIALGGGVAVVVVVLVIFLKRKG